MLQRHRLSLGEGGGGVLGLPGLDRVQSLVERLPPLPSPLARLGGRPGSRRAQAHFASQRLPCLAGVPIEPVPKIQDFAPLTLPSPVIWR
jgi:hypothetical protein